MSRGATGGDAVVWRWLVAAAVVAGVATSVVYASRTYPRASQTYGYRLVAGDGGVFAFGSSYRGSLGELGISQRIVAAAAHPSGSGYWLLAADGEVFGFGDALLLDEPEAEPGRRFTAIAPTPSGRGYWLGARDGAVLAFGDAADFGRPSLGPGQQLAALIAAPGGDGYLALTSDGQVQAVGAARRLPPRPPHRRGAVAVGMAATSTSTGYWIAFADGTVAAFGDAEHRGDVAGRVDDVVGILASRTGRGYSLVTSSGRVRPFGDAPRLDDLEGIRANASITAIIS